MKMNDPNFYLTQGAEGFDDEIIESSEDMNYSFTQVDQDEELPRNKTPEGEESEEYIDLCISQSQFNDEKNSRLNPNDDKYTTTNSSHEIHQSTLETVQDSNDEYFQHDPTSDPETQQATNFNEEEYIDLRISQSQIGEPGIEISPQQIQNTSPLYISDKELQESPKYSEDSEEYIDLQISQSPHKSPSQSPNEESPDVRSSPELISPSKPSEESFNGVSEVYIDLHISQSQLSREEKSPAISVPNVKVIVVNGNLPTENHNEISYTFPTQLDEINSQDEEDQENREREEESDNSNLQRENQISLQLSNETQEPSLGTWLDTKHHEKADGVNIFPSNKNNVPQHLERFNTLDCANLLSNLSSNVQKDDSSISSPIEENDVERLKSNPCDAEEKDPNDKHQRIYNTFQASLPTISSTPGSLKNNSINLPNSSHSNNSGTKIKRKFGSAEKVLHQKDSNKYNDFSYSAENDIERVQIVESDEEMDFNEIKSSSKDSKSESTSDSSKEIVGDTHEFSVKDRNLPTGYDNWPTYIPSTFIKEVPEGWGEFWGELEDVGWYWTKGKGLIDFFYIKPDCKSSKPFKMNIDFFPSGDDVHNYIQNEINSFYVKFPSLLPKNSSKSKSSSVVQFENNATKKEKNRNLIKKRFLEDDDEEEFLETPEEDENKFFGLGEDSSFNVNNNNRIHQEKNNNSSADIEKYDIRKVEWKILWRFLRERGWTWDFGPGTHYYYYIPGFSYKQDKQAILGTHKFDTEDGIRRFIRKEIQKGRGSEWPMFFVSLNRTESMLQESQQVDAHLLDPEWNLVKYRKKRETSAKFDKEEMDQINDNELKRVSKAKKISPPEDSNPSQANIQTSSSSILNKSNSINPSSSSKRPTRILIEQPLTANISTSQMSGKKKDNAEANGNQMIFNNWKIMFSGIKEETRDKLEKIVLQQGGKVISDFPLAMFPPQSNAPISHRHGQSLNEAKHKILLISQPKDFRKPKYLYSLIAGIPVIHFNWVVHSAQQQRFLPLIHYLLPSGYSALHSYYYYPDLSHWDSQLSRYNVSLEGFYRNNCRIFVGKKILNLTNMKIWDDILSFGGVTLIANPFSPQNSQSQSNSRFGSTYNIPSNIDFIIFDPVVYTRSIIHYQHQNQIPRPNSRDNSSSIKHILSLPEVQFLQSNQSNTTSDCVVSIDWFTHCIALNEIIDQTKCLDLFSLPNDPIRYPLAYKSDLEYFQLLENNSSKKKSSDGSKQPIISSSLGERFSKYDLVSFKSNSLLSPAAMSVQSDGKSTTSNLDNITLIGKIQGFSRRNEKSPLLVRVNILELVTMPSKDHYPRQCAFPDESCIQEDVLISIDQLVGKFVLLEEDTYEAHVSYFSESNLTILGSNNKPFANVTPTKDQPSTEPTDILCSTSPAYHRQNPLILYSQVLINQYARNKHLPSESEDDDEDNSQSFKRRKYSHIQASQDI